LPLAIIDTFSAWNACSTVRHRIGSLVAADFAKFADGASLVHTFTFR